MIYDVAELLPLQTALYRDIATRHQVTYETTRTRRLLALTVELAELANSTRVFKYWSLKAPESSDRVLDEAADCLHFFLSLFLDVGVSRTIFDVDPRQVDGEDLSSLFLDTYQALGAFRASGAATDLTAAFSLYLQIVARLGFDDRELKRGYLGKLKVNYQRQQRHY